MMQTLWIYSLNNVLISHGSVSFSHHCEPDTLALFKLTAESLLL